MLTAAAVVVLVAGLRAAAPLLRPLLLALFLATLSLPLMRWLVARRVRPGLAVSATVLANILLLTALGFAVSTDGLRWHKHPANPVLRPDPDRAWGLSEWARRADSRAAWMAGSSKASKMGNISEPSPPVMMPPMAMP